MHIHLYCRCRAGCSDNIVISLGELRATLTEYPILVFRFCFRSKCLGFEINKQPANH